MSRRMKPRESKKTTAVRQTSESRGIAKNKRVSTPRMLNLKNYLKQNDVVRLPGPEGEWWTPTARSRGKRQFKFSTKSSQHSVAVIDGVAVNAESRLERKGILVLRARPDTVSVVEQSPQITYVDADGVLREHTFDVLVARTDGKKIAVDIKPSSLVKSSCIRELHAILLSQMPHRTADALLVLTDRMFTAADFYNAELMNMAAKQKFPNDDVVILDLVRRMKSAAPIADLVKRSGLYGYGFNAVVRAIAAGQLRMTARIHIDYPAVVAPVRGSV
jgi:hypothetical protein